MLSDVNEEVSKRISFPLLEKFPFEININCHAFSSKREEESSSKIGGPSQISVHWAKENERLVLLEKESPGRNSFGRVLNESYEDESG